jgi:hypothetical protein
MFSAGQGIADGFTYRAHEAKDFQPRSARVEINIKRKTRLVFGRTHGAEDPSHRGNVLGFLSGQVPVPGIGRGRYH